MSGVSAVTLAAQLLGMLASPAYKTIASAYNLENDVQELQDCVDIISKYLEDAEDKLSKEQSRPQHGQGAGITSINVWLQKLKDALEDASDILDEIEYEALRKQVMKENASCTRKVLHFCSGFNPLAFRFIMSCKIKGIRERIRWITSYRGKLGLKAIYHANRQSVSDWLSWRETHSRLPSRVTGRDGEKYRITNLLGIPQSQVNRIDVIAIVGQGGLGKTTLAQLVYNDKWVAKHFLRLWVYVSNEFELKRLISDILKAAVGTERETETERNFKNSNLEQLTNSLCEALRKKRFLLVLDDVWNEDTKRWQDLYDILLGLSDDGNKEGSKIIVTTRSHRVASVMGTTDEYKLQLEELPMTACRELFFKCVFPNGGEERFPRLIEIGKKIVTKCKGVPLAVVCLGCLLSSNYNTRAWMRIQNSELWQLKKDKDSIFPPLRLSYNELAPQLKQCFSYCSIFPKDYKYNDLHMIPFWMAHGLLQPENDGEEPEHVGESYRNKLLEKSFFQPQLGTILEFHELLGNITLTMHHILHDLALLKMTNEQVTVTTDCTSVHKNVRHLSFCNDVFPIVGHRYPKKVRTINVLRMGGEDDEISRFLNWIFNEFKYLRVLDFTSSLLKSLPDSLGKMKYLRYLRLRYCYLIEELPDSLCDLHNLQCLNLEGCNALVKLPKNMGRFLVSLRIFFITTQDTNLSFINIGCFKRLQVLTITDCHNLVSLPRDLQRLTTLKKLFIRNCQNLKSLEDEEEQEANQTELTQSAEQEENETKLTESAEQEANQTELSENAEQEAKTESTEQEANQTELTKSAEKEAKTETAEQEAKTESAEQEANQTKLMESAGQEVNQTELMEGAEQQTSQTELTESAEQEANQTKLMESAGQEANQTELMESAEQETSQTGLTESAKQEANQTGLTESAKCHGPGGSTP